MSFKNVHVTRYILAIQRFGVSFKVGSQTHVHEYSSIYSLYFTSFSDSCTDADNSKCVRIYHLVSQEFILIFRFPFSAGSSVVVIVTTDQGGLPVTQTMYDLLLYP